MVSSVCWLGEVEPTVGDDDLSGNVVVGAERGHQIGDVLGLGRAGASAHLVFQSSVASGQPAVIGVSTRPGRHGS